MLLMCLPDTPHVVPARMLFLTLKFPTSFVKFSLSVFDLSSMFPKYTGLKSCLSCTPFSFTFIVKLVSLLFRWKQGTSEFPIPGHNLYFLKNSPRSAKSVYNIDSVLTYSLLVHQHNQIFLIQLRVNS